MERNLENSFHRAETIGESQQQLEMRHKTVA